MCLYLYIHNKYTQYTLVYYVNKTFILDAINRLTALILLFIYLFIFCGKKVNTGLSILYFTMSFQELRYQDFQLK